MQRDALEMHRSTMVEFLVGIITGALEHSNLGAGATAAQLDPLKKWLR